MKNKNFSTLIGYNISEVKLIRLLRQTDCVNYVEYTFVSSKNLMKYFNIRIEYWNNKNIFILNFFDSTLLKEKRVT